MGLGTDFSDAAKLAYKDPAQLAALRQQAGRFRDFTKERLAALENVGTYVALTHWFDYTLDIIGDEATTYLPLQQTIESKPGALSDRDFARVEHVLAMMHVGASVLENLVQFIDGHNAGNLRHSEVPVSKRLKRVISHNTNLAYATLVTPAPVIRDRAEEARNRREYLDRADMLEEDKLWDAIEVKPAPRRKLTQLERLAAGEPVEDEPIDNIDEYPELAPRSEIAQLVREADLREAASYTDARLELRTSMNEWEYFDEVMDHFKIDLEALPDEIDIDEQLYPFRGRTATFEELDRLYQQTPEWRKAAEEFAVEQLRKEEEKRTNPDYWFDHQYELYELSLDELLESPDFSDYDEFDDEVQGDVEQKWVEERSGD